MNFSWPKNGKFVQGGSPSNELLFEKYSLDRFDGSNTDLLLAVSF